MNDPSHEPTSSTPTPLTKTLSNLRSTNASLSERIGSLTALVEHRTTQLESLTAQLTSAQSRITELNSDVEKGNDRSARRARKIKLLEMEVASTNALLATFSAEEAVFREDGKMGMHDAENAMRIRDLEAMVNEYKKEYEALQKQFDAVTGSEEDVKPNVARNGNGSAPMEVENAISEERKAREAAQQG